jgi:hypothetical protein
MMIFLKEHLVFLATPKTASTSIEMALGPHCDIRLAKTPNAKHTPLRKYKRFLEPFVQTLVTGEADTVAMIREPVEWLGSWYRYRGRESLNGKSNSTANISFNQFIEGYLSEPQPEFAHVGSQSRFLSDKDGKLGVDYLFCYEDMAGLLRFLENRLGRQVTIGRLNVSPVAELALSPELHKELRRRFAQDFEIYEQFRK